MCIRDRPGLEVFCQPKVHDFGQLPGPHMTPARMLELAKLCLLYTSDAADERSSVDLGGRRIIKKKQRNIHGCVNYDNSRTHTITHIQKSDNIR
mgnify:CR=1 FL=1